MCSVMVIIVGNKFDEQSSNLGLGCISFYTNSLGKGMNLSLSPLAMSTCPEKEKHC